ncbi:MAG: hypothetical protein AAB898_01680 [Patescibacteria group bacterium]
MTNSLRNLLVLAYATAHKAAPVALAIVVAVSTVLSSIPSASAQIAFPGWPVETVEKMAPVLPVAGDRAAPRKMKLSVTAYNSLPEQTDSTPFHTADGTHVRDGIVAANFLPLGTRVKFPDLYGDKEFVVKDRMNARYHRRADIWMAEKPDAIAFGHRYTTVEIY